MSSERNGGSNSNHSKCSDRVDTDAVHSRFRPIMVHCDICNMDVVGDHSAIEKHFDDSHPAKEYCCYCKGKVYSYTQMPIDSAVDKPRHIIYHKCKSF